MKLDVRGYMDLIGGNSTRPGPNYCALLKAAPPLWIYVQLAPCGYHTERMCCEPGTSVWRFWTCSAGMPLVLVGVAPGVRPDCRFLQPQSRLKLTYSAQPASGILARSGLPPGGRSVLSCIVLARAAGQAQKHRYLRRLRAAETIAEKERAGPRAGLGVCVDSG